MPEGSSGTYHPETTRRKLLEAAYDEIWRSGFRGASLENILTQTCVTKGALYHHFRNKLEMGYAVVDEVLREKVRVRWIEPLEAAEDPIEVLQRLPARSDATLEELERRHGCPLSNLVQEMSGIDEGFRLRIHSILMEWRDAIASALYHGQERGLVRENIRPAHAAMFVVSVLQGSASLAKSAQDPTVCGPCFEGLHYYLEALRPRRGFRS